jgi:hypothetical protein
MIEYAVCGGWGYAVEDAQQKLVVEVQKMINEGWIPTGGVSGTILPASDDWERNVFYYSQAIVRDMGSSEEEIVKTIFALKQTLRTGI